MIVYFPKISPLRRDSCSAVSHVRRCELCRSCLRRDPKNADHALHPKSIQRTGSATVLTKICCTCVQREAPFSLATLSHRTDESIVTLIRTDTSPDEEKKTECRTWKICSHADQRCAQHSHSHSVGKCVCGQVVRRVEKQVNSVRE